MTRSKTTQGQLDKVRDDKIAALEAEVKELKEQVERFLQAVPSAGKAE